MEEIPSLGVEKGRRMPEDRRLHLSQRLLLPPDECPTERPSILDAAVKPLVSAGYMSVHTIYEAAPSSTTNDGLMWRAPDKALPRAR